MSSGNWRDDEIRELLAARAGISWQMNGTARDSVVYDQITKRLQERGFCRAKAQVITKLKALKKTYHRFLKYNSCEGNEPRWWTYFQMCDDIWGSEPLIKQIVVGGGGIKDSPPTSPGTPGNGTETETPGNGTDTPVNRAEAAVNGAETRGTSPETNMLGRPVNTPEKPEPAASSWSCAEQSDSGEQWVSNNKRPACETFDPSFRTLKPKRRRPPFQSQPEKKANEMRELFVDMIREFDERERAREQEQREYEERVRREYRAEREQEMAVLNEMNSLLRQILQRMPPNVSTLVPESFSRRTPYIIALPTAAGPLSGVTQDKGTQV